ncbi:hypothetical protein C8R43DRAFT_1174965 [Mycena crocata]|nr:hypothetical protein C8R43DRAFT_1174965 [Mycena crocata]
MSGHHPGTFYASITPGNLPKRCERPGCFNTAPPGVDLHNVHDRKDPSRGYGVCPDCKAYYDNKTVKKYGLGVDLTDLPAPPNSRTVALVQQANAKANRGRPVNPVQPLGVAGYPPAPRYTSGSMGPPPVPMGPPPAPMQSGNYHSNHRGPNIQLPGNTSNLNAYAPGGSRNGTPSTSGIGYTSNHGGYMAVRAQKQRIAYAPASDHRIILELRGVCRRPSLMKADMIFDMLFVEGDVKPSISGTRLKSLAWEKLIPIWDHRTNNYPLDYDACKIYNKDWVEILVQPGFDNGVIEQNFYRHNAKDPNNPIFKSKKFRVDLSIPHKTYAEFLAFEEEAALQAAESEEELTPPPRKRSTRSAKPSTRQSTRSASQSRSTRSASQSRSTRSVPRSQSANSEPQSSRYGNLNSASFSGQDPIDVDDNEEGKKTPLFIKSSAVEISASQLVSKSTGELSMSNAASITKAGKSSSAISKKALVKALLKQTPPTKQEIRSLTVFTTFAVQLRVAKKDYTLVDLLQNDSASFDSLVESPPIDVTLHLDLRPNVQKRGGFKMSSFGTSSIPLFGKDAKDGGRDICAKQSYYSLSTGSQTQYYAHPCPRQAEDLMIELRCNVWASSLLKDVYSCIDELLVNLPPKESPPTIPRLRFVGVAFATGGKQLNAESSGALYLIEERITESVEGPFRKYINNRQPIPTEFNEEDNINTAAFLAFTQHWQFKRMHGLAFVSDYQGGNTLLTDPQIMSAPSLGDIFGTGNIPTGCRDFAASHFCNEFCKYFEIADNFDPFDDAPNDSDDGDGLSDMSISMSHAESRGTNLKRKRN